MIAEKPGNFRWRIVLLLFFATTINYIDRQVLSFTMIDETFRREMMHIPADQPLTESQLDEFKVLYSYVDTAFKVAYTLGFLLTGWLIDWVGTKRGFSISIIVWSVAGVLNAFAGSLRSLSLVRFMLGIGEAGNFPSAVKSVAEWFPRQERAFANGIFNAGANVGVIVTALFVPWLTIQYGWRFSFIATGVLGFLVLIAWWTLYHRPEDHPRLSRSELAYIEQDDDEDLPDEKLFWWRLLGLRQTWAFIVGKFLCDPIWWFYLTWLPDFFNSNEALDEKLNLTSMGLPFLVIYIVSDGGSVLFGWLSSKFILLGWSLNRARKTTMLLCALCVVPIFFAAQTSSIYIAIALISLATAAHQGWSANLYTFASDLFPKSAVASVTGLGGMFGAIGGILLAAVAGTIRVSFGYQPLFLIAGSSYLIALLIIHSLTPTLKPVNRKELESLTV